MGFYEDFMRNLIYSILLLLFLSPSLVFGSGFGGGGGAAWNTPGAIGNTTPNTGTFTVLNAVSMTFGGSSLIDMQHLHVSSQLGTKKVEFGADKLAVYDLSGNTYFIQQVPVIVQDGAVNGVDGLDTGALTVNTWYHLHCIYNPTTKLAAGLLSLSKTSPTLPPGYTAFRWISTFRTDAASNFLYQHQTDKEVYYLIDDAGVNRVLNGGTATTMTVFSLNTLLPVDAEEVFLNVIGTANATSIGSNANINISPVIYPANVATPLLTTGYGVLQIVSSFTSLSIVVEQRSWWRMRLGPGNENGSSPPSQSMAYMVSNSTGGVTTAYIDVMGYYLPL
jgi:hypothetical protein